MSYIIPYKSVAPKIDPSVFLAPTATVAGDVEIGEGASIWFNVVIRGDFQPIRIGKNTNVQDNAVIHVMANVPTEIGDEVTIGHNAIIHARKIGNNCLVGMGSILLGYTEIGDNVVIGAGTMITQHKKIPSNSLVYGNPAQIIRALREDEIEALHDSALDYRKVAEKYKAELL
ncbi:MAG: gamma carbonic anhydrase family protein [Selenomonas ruminantium]|jgi:carbonic anhydrase/acetyltransferase-like protein (isoleucine patch superfamily)|nr:gamma carbonic anhydrase family protein [Selenomonas ruminantium]